ncbi:MAG: hypothetical protein AAFV95_10700 [Bacteroidota bacterium]
MNNLIRIGLSGLVLLTSFLSLQAQSYQDNQRKLDLHHGGIGLEVARPTFGAYSGAETPWYGINLLADGFEFRWLMGRIGMNPSEGLGFTDDKLPKPDSYGNNYIGREWSVGALFPFTKIRLGAQAGSAKVARFHPILGINFGSYAFWEEGRYDQDKDWYGYMGIKPGVRLRLPLVTAELTLNTTIGLYSGDLNKPVRWVNFMPSLVIRLDALKQKLDPSMVYVDGAQVNVENYTSKTTSRTYTRGTGTGKQRVTEITTESSADIRVKPTKVGIQDIGPFFGIGPKLSVSSIRSDHAMPVGVMYGAEVTTKSGWFYLSLNVEGGKIGHASEMENPEDKKEKKVNLRKDFGRGSYQTAMGYFDIGIDISPIALSMLGVVREETTGTSYFSLMAGYSIGLSNMRNQQFDNPAAAATYDQLLANNREDIQAYRLDPREAGFGRVASWWIGMDVGVLSFRIRKLNHIRSPFANNTFISMSYKIKL